MYRNLTFLHPLGNLIKVPERNFQANSKVRLGAFFFVIDVNPTRNNS